MATKKAPQSVATGKAWTLARTYEGTPKPSDFKLVEEKVDTSLKDGEILVEAQYLSVDPYMRVAPVQVGSVMVGEQVARVKASKNPEFPVGCQVLFHHGWRTLAVISPKMDKNDGLFGGLMLRKVPDLGGLSASTALGVLGMPGLTAYFGTVDKGKPKRGDVVMISAAAGAVGSVAGQIAKIMGATVIGSAGTDQKCKLLRDLGFDHVFNYKNKSVDDALKEFSIEGIDLYFENVGGEYAWSVYNHMNKEGRVVVCGAISTYNKGGTMIGDHDLYQPIIFKCLTLSGLLIWQYYDRFNEGVAQLSKWIKEGRLKYKECVIDGFDKMPDAFISLFSGANTGKVVVKV